MQQPSIPKGTRDFSPQEIIKRNYIFNTIRHQFELFGFMPIETPSMENLSTLLGKYGEEGDKLLFKILNSGDFLSEVPANQMNTANAHLLSSMICDKGLRYDLTVPFARYVVMHRNEITFPFRRYQIQSVWRADKPQKGRYREFFQCDADIIGSNSLLNEMELLQVIDLVFSKLNIKVKIKINNRKILAGIAEMIGEGDKITDITVAIDKIEKIGIHKVNEELISRGISTNAVARLQPVLELNGSNPQKIHTLETVLQSIEIGIKGVEEMKLILDYTSSLPLSSSIELDLRLARGLNYYTGAIIEVKASDVEIGSICGGGRYDNLTGIFGLEGVSGVGISFGADRIYDVLSQLNIFPETAGKGIKVMFVNFGIEEEKLALTLAQELRNDNINCIVYPEQAKIKKQFAYADNLNIPYVVIIGEEELKSESITLKNMVSGEQQNIPAKDLLKSLQ